MAYDRIHNRRMAYFQGNPEMIIDNPETLGEVMNNLGIRIKNETLKQIDDNFENTSNKLRESFDYRTQVFGESFIARVYMADYYDFINKGVRGSDEAKYKYEYIDVVSKKGNLYKKIAKDDDGNPKRIEWDKHDIDSKYFYKSLKPPVNSIKEWLNGKGLNAYNPFAVQTSIWAKGIKGSGYFDNVVQDVKGGKIHLKLINDLRSAGKLSILNEIKKIIRE